MDIHKIYFFPPKSIFFKLSLNQPWNIKLTYLESRNLGLSFDVLFVNMSEGLEEIYIEF